MNTSRMYNQYLQIKADYPDAIVFFQVGDFYEAFDTDAELVAVELGRALAFRQISPAKRVPMCGIPYFSIEEYTEVLNKIGYRVAVAEQV